MKMKYCLTCVCALFASVEIVHGVQFDKGTGHADFLRKHFDVSYWKSTWTDDTWHIRGIFVDMDGDGEDEMIAATTSEEDRTGDVWKIWMLGSDGKMRQVIHSGEVYFSCRAESFYKMNLQNGTSIVLGLGLNAGRRDLEGRRITAPTPDCAFALTKDGKYSLHEISPDVDTAFREKTVVSIERLYPEWYFGFTFTPPANMPHDPCTMRMPYRIPRGNIQVRGGVECPKGFAAFAAEYGRTVQKRVIVEGDVTVYAVFLDADNDGDVDCYVSCSAEKASAETFRWNLFLRDQDKLSKADAVVYPVARKKNICRLSPSVIASRDAFCRIVRYDVEPFFMVLDNKTTGRQVRDSITHYSAHCIEKLSCAEIRVSDAF